MMSRVIVRLGFVVRSIIEKEKRHEENSVSCRGVHRHVVP